MKKEELQYYISQNLSIRKIAHNTNKSASSIRHWLEKYDLKTTRSEKSAICKFCGDTDLKNFMLSGSGRISKSRCKKCHSKYSILRFRNNKKKAVEYKGGKCMLCGYDNCMRSLSFHHRDPKFKDPNWNKMRNWKFEKLKKELDKCDLVCNNCHGEIHEKLGGWGC